MFPKRSRRIFLKHISSLAIFSGLAARMSLKANASALDLALDQFAEELSANSWGRVVRPGDPEHSTIKYHNGRFDCVKTTSYLHPTTIEGVQKILNWATLHRRTLAMRGGGHSFEGKSSHPALVVDLAQMTQLHFNKDGTLAVEAGVRLGEVYKVLGAAGHVLPAGTCPTVGIVGHTLGGGIGDFLPMFGYAAQSLKEATLVTMGGTILRVNDQAIEVLGGAPLPLQGLNAKDLMKVLRGGGQGSLGVVTNMTFQTHDVRSAKLASFRLTGTDRLGPQKAIAIIRRWQAWREKLPKPMQSIVSSKLDLGRSRRGYSIDIAGLIVIPPSSKISISDVRRKLSDLFHISGWRKKNFAKRLNAAGAIRSFLDSDETTNNPARKRFYGSSTVLPAALPKRALQHLIWNLPNVVEVSFYTSGGNSKTGPETSLHPSEFLIEWVAWNIDEYHKIRSINTEMLRMAGFEDFAYPNYPDIEMRDYFLNQPMIQSFRNIFDSARLSTSSLLADKSTSSTQAGCP